MRNSFVVILISIFIFISSSYADNTPELYSATVPVSNQSSQSRHMAIQKALSNVLIKVSGNTGINQLPDIRPLAKQASLFLQSYSYGNSNQTKQTTAWVGENHSLFLTAHFDPKLIRRALIKAGQTTWGANRPLVLVWAGIKQSSETTIISSSQNSLAKTFFDKTANQRGLPIIFPLIDLKDLHQVSVSDIMAPYPKLIQRASQRYHSNVILIARINQQKNLWRGQWTLLLSTGPISWDTHGMSEGQVIENGMNKIADALANRYGSLITTQDQSELAITINHIYSHGDLLKAQNGLKNLSPVTHVRLAEINGSDAVFILQVSGGEAALNRALNLDKPFAHNAGLNIRVVS